MYNVEEDGVNEALRSACKLVMSGELTEILESRNGRVKVFDEPVTTRYRFPNQHVLLSPLRDANPFFHLFEALWMLGGQNDVAFPSRFNSNIANYSDNGETFHGAYGHRWRQWFKSDQLGRIINQLRKNPRDRRVVLSMWDPYIDPDVADAGGKDVPCNTQAYFGIKQDRLDLMVTNRSNDMIWGAYGANAVHMSMLLEYVANALDIEPGAYEQVSFNMHVYEQHWGLVDMIAQADWDCSVIPYITHVEDGGFCINGEEQYNPDPLFGPGCIDHFDADVATFLREPFNPKNKYKTHFFDATVRYMAQAYFCYKEMKNWDMAVGMIEQVHARDWRVAARQWLNRREPGRIVVPQRDVGVGPVDIETSGPTIEFPGLNPSAAWPFPVDKKD